MNYATDKPPAEVRKRLEAFCEACKSALKTRLQHSGDLEAIEANYETITEAVHAFLLDTFKSSDVASKIDVYIADGEHWIFEASVRDFRQRVQWDLKKLEEIRDDFEKPPALPSAEPVIAASLFDKSKDYIKNVVRQINGCYEHGLHDACGVMIRRLVETLIIEIYKHRGETAQIKDGDGNFLMLSALVEKLVGNNHVFNLSKNTRSGLPKIVDLGHLCAHNTTFKARANDIDKNMLPLRVIAEELLTLADMAA